MVSSKADTVAAYLDSLPADRRSQIVKLRKVILENLPAGYEEGMQYGMIGYYIPLSRYPVTYNKQPLGIAALAAQKNAMSLYLMTVYGDPALKRWFEEGFRKAGKKLDMGKSCVRFKNIDDLPLPLIGETIAKVGVDDYIAIYEKARSGTSSARAKSAAKPEKKPATKVAKKKLTVKSVSKPATKTTKQKTAKKKVASKTKRRA